MFSIYDGRKAFYQWDLDRKLIVEDASINQVHFCNRTEECSLVCEVYEENGLYLVNVPNVLLQTDWRINVYGYDKNYTKHSAVFEVYKRTKPDSYIYTDTEVLSFNTLLNRMEEIESNIAETVEDYLEENPPEVSLDGYATTNYVDKGVEEAKEYTDKAVSNIPKTDLTDYATKKYVSDAIEDIEIPVVPTKVSAFTNDAGYLTKHQSLANYALKSEIPSLDGYAKKSDIPSINGLASETYVDNAISNINSEVWSFTLSDGSTVTKEVLLK